MEQQQTESAVTGGPTGRLSRACRRAVRGCLWTLNLLVLAAAVVVVTPLGNWLG
ncbi:hypothetical protein LCGC14_1599580, partial [marine sediment metagenome]